MISGVRQQFFALKYQLKRKPPNMKIIFCIKKQGEKNYIIVST